MKPLYFFLIFTIFFTGCKKADNSPFNAVNELPAITHTGANTFGCLIDGKPFAISGKAYLGHETGVSFIAFVNRAWYASAKLKDQSVMLNFDYNSSPSIPGTFEMSDNYPAGAEFLNPSNGNTAITGGNDFKTDSVHKGVLTFQYYDGKIAAGIFSFDCANDAGQVIHITDGRFDISL